jgi:hypothetical protein
MKVRYFNIHAADCTSDPHPVDYKDLGGADRLRTMLEDIQRVCESDMVQSIRFVRGAVGFNDYEADEYIDWSGPVDKRFKPAGHGVMAKKHKVAGLYLAYDAEKSKKHLPPGLTGVKEFIKVALADPEDFDRLKVGVVWTFAGQASCADNIEINGEHFGLGEVDFSSQDSWCDYEGYLPWCKAMEEFLGRSFPRSKS